MTSEPEGLRLLGRVRVRLGFVDEDDPDYVPDVPPDWARVVVIGSR
ncbi:hypothetical protein ABZW44_25960 [Streptomyces mirabilis]